MAKTKSGRLYKQIKSQSYTRREYMGGVPGSRIVQFELGDKAGAFPITASLVAEERCAITHNALESARVAANRILLKGCGPTGYHLKIRPYPHEVIRENKQASGAGADRVSQGMRLSFGKAIGTAARIELGQPIMTIRLGPQHFLVLKEACRKANMKLPTPTRMVIESGHAAVNDFLTGKIKAAKIVKGPAAPKEKPAEGAEGAAPAEGEAAKAEGGKPEGKPGEKGKGGEAKPAAGGKGEAKPAGKEEKKGGKK